MLSLVAEIIAVISIVGHIVVYVKHKTLENVMLGFLHGMKPNIESASNGHAVPAATWKGVLDQVNDMLARLQPPKR